MRRAGVTKQEPSWLAVHSASPTGEPTANSLSCGAARGHGGTRESTARPDAPRRRASRRGKAGHRRGPRDFFCNQHVIRKRDQKPTGRYTYPKLLRGKKNSHPRPPSWGRNTTVQLRTTRGPRNVTSIWRGRCMDVIRRVKVSTLPYRTLPHRNLLLTTSLDP